MHHESKTNASANSARSVARQRHDTGLEREKITVRQRLVKSRFSHRSSFTSTRACEREGQIVRVSGGQIIKVGRKGVRYLLTARVVEAAHVRSLRADYWESLLEVVKYGERSVELGSNRWHRACGARLCPRGGSCAVREYLVICSDNKWWHHAP